MTFLPLKIIYRGYDLTRASDGSYDISKNGVFLITAPSEDAAMTVVDALRRAKVQGAT